MYLLGLKGKAVNFELNAVLNKKQKIAYSIGRSIGSRVPLSVDVFFCLTSSILRSISKIILTSFDIALICGYSLFYLKFIHHKGQENSPIKIFRVDELYTIYFLKDKRHNSCQYYYPDFESREHKNAFITDFDDKWNFISLGIIEAQKHKEILSYLNFISPKSLLKAFSQFISLYRYELFGQKNNTFGGLISLIRSLKNANRKLLALLIYNTALSMYEDLRPNQIYIWSENQISNKSLALGLKDFLCKSDYDKINIYSYIGYIYSANSLPQYVPKRYELNRGIWGKNHFLVQDKDSRDELRSVLFNYLDIAKVNLARNSLRRNSGLTNNSINSLKSSANRYVTIIVGIDVRELFIIMVRLFSNMSPRFSQLNTDKCYVRLHPNINEKEAIKEFDRANKNFSLRVKRIEFINKDQETLSESIAKSKYCIFGNSGYLNSAVKSGSNVIAVRTSFLYGPQIQKRYLDRDNLIIV